jgi:1-acyl-sn-glycerol-3-phosphate acyltransferase
MNMLAPTQEWHEFVREWMATGVYRTPANLPLAWVDRCFGRFDWRCHYVAWREVVRCANVARKGSLSDDAWGQKSFEAMRAMERCGGRLEMDMPESTRRVGPCVYVANHMSVLETLLLPCMLVPFRHPTFVIKQDLLRYPALRHIMAKVGPISVSRDNPREDLKQVLTEGVRSLEAGNSVLVFPQATRDPVFDPAFFNTLGVKLAARAEVPVVPLALQTDFCGIGRIVKEMGPIDRSRPVRFRYGEPIPPSVSSKEAHGIVVDMISGALRGWGVQVKV